MFIRRFNFTTIQDIGKLTKDIRCNRSLDLEHTIVPRVIPTVELYLQNTAPFCQILVEYLFRVRLIMRDDIQPSFVRANSPIFFSNSIASYYNLSLTSRHKTSDILLMVIHF